MTSLSDLLEAGLLKSGEDLIWYRRTSGQTYRAVVNDDGSLTTAEWHFPHILIMQTRILDI
jgi:hypothetical protein